MNRCNATCAHAWAKRRLRVPGLSVASHSSAEVHSHEKS